MANGPFCFCRLNPVLPIKSPNCIPGPFVALSGWGCLLVCDIRIRLMCSNGSCSKSFWDSPPRRRPWKACPSQNDDFLHRFGLHPLQTSLQGTSIPKRFGTTLFQLLCGLSGWFVWHFSGGLCGTCRPLFPSRVFPMCHIRKRIGLPRGFSSRSITSGNGKTGNCKLLFRKRQDNFCFSGKFSFIL